jgi:putative pyruvate formate lyase activating enzyme
MTTLPDLSEIRNPRERDRVGKAFESLRNCSVCPRNCGVNRLLGETGTCRTGLLARVSSANLHFGEEPPISGTRGSGTVFFAYCNLACDFCQNFPISAHGYGREMSPRMLSETFLGLEGRGAHNINLVTPSHVVPQIIFALVLARELGLSIPVVYNSNGYDQPEMLHLLEGLIDIYLPDMKYSDDRTALRISKAPNYTSINRKAVSIMAAQVGPLDLDDDKIARKGLLIRHLLLPGGLSGFSSIARHIREELGTGTAISMMAQYFPAHRASRTPFLARKITEQEYEEGLSTLFSEQLLEGYVQDLALDEEPLSGLKH